MGRGEKKKATGKYVCIVEILNSDNRSFYTGGAAQCTHKTATAAEKEFSEILRLEMKP